MLSNIFITIGKKNIPHKNPLNYLKENNLAFFIDNPKVF